MLVDLRRVPELKSRVRVLVSTKRDSYQYTSSLPRGIIAEHEDIANGHELVLRYSSPRTEVSPIQLAMYF